MSDRRAVTAAGQGREAERIAGAERRRPPTKPRMSPTSGKPRIATGKSELAAGKPSRRPASRVRKAERDEDIAAPALAAPPLRLATLSCRYPSRRSLTPRQYPPSPDIRGNHDYPPLDIAVRRHPRAGDGMPGPDEAAVAAVRARDARLTKPPGSLGRLEEIAEWLAAWQGREPPARRAAVVAVFAGNHGVVAQGVSAYPQAVTSADGRQFPGRRRGHQPDLQTFDLGLKVFELALDDPTGDITQGRGAGGGRLRRDHRLSAWRRSPAAPISSASARWASATRRSPPRSAMALYGGEAEDWVGPGTGVDAEGLKRKADAVRRAVALHRPHLERSARSAAPARRPRDRGDGGRHPRGAAFATSRC